MIFGTPILGNLLSCNVCMYIYIYIYMYAYVDCH